MSTAEKSLNRIFGRVVNFQNGLNLPEEFNNETYDNNYHKRVQKAKNLLFDIISQYYNIPKDADIILNKITKERDKINFSRSRVVLLVVYKFYGKELPKPRNINFKRNNQNIEQNHGIKRYYNFNSKNELDNSILKNVRELVGYQCYDEEHICRKILAKRLLIGFTPNIRNKERIDNVIENRIQSKCELYNKDRDTVVREAFCTHFNIKI